MNIACNFITWVSYLLDIVLDTMFSFIGDSVLDA